MVGDTRAGVHQKGRQSWGSGPRARSFNANSDSRCPRLFEAPQVTFPFAARLGGRLEPVHRVTARDDCAMPMVDLASQPRLDHGRVWSSYSPLEFGEAHPHDVLFPVVLTGTAKSRWSGTRRRSSFGWLRSGLISAGGDADKLRKGAIVGAHKRVAQSRASNQRATASHRRRS